MMNKQNKKPKWEKKWDEEWDEEWDEGQAMQPAGLLDPDPGEE